MYSITVGFSPVRAELARSIKLLFQPYPVEPCMVTHGHTHSKIMDQPGKASNPAHGQLNRENNHFPVRVRA